MNNRDIIVIGGSSGATAPLKTILGALPAELVSRMADDGRRSGRRSVAEMYEARALEYRQYADTLRKAVLQSMTSLASRMDEAGPESDG
ncbi:hypothetical protein [Microvirga sp. Mcv34]|uniref:hypothetical protein n=1 Tax=Microvirga sp. Mcv34 TaxID=2926016 RepID=UPI003966B9D4